MTHTDVKRANRWWGRIRDRVGYTLASASFSLATPYYRKRLRDLLIAGMRAADADSKVPAPTPYPNWVTEEKLSEKHD